MEGFFASLDSTQGYHSHLNTALICKDQEEKKGRGRVEPSFEVVEVGKNHELDILTRILPVSTLPPHYLHQSTVILSNKTPTHLLE
jgi:hypothetical protein